MPMNILVTLDQNYLPPLRTMLKSLFLNNEREAFRVYLVHADIPQEELDRLEKFCAGHGCGLEAIAARDELFTDAPVFGHYTKAMYYRLMANELLPREVDRALYLDPDILVINPVRPFYETEIGDYLYAGAIHYGITGSLTDFINKLRLGNDDADGYYNSGVLLMNMARQREEVRAEDIFDYVRNHKEELILPDQDVMNALYGAKTRTVDESMYNYDARFYQSYLLKSGGEKDIDWVMRNTVFLHFCGASKPWHDSVIVNRFATLYKHYMCITDRTLAAIAGSAL